MKGITYICKIPEAHSVRDGGILHPAESLPLLGCFILIALTSVIPIGATLGCV